MKTTYYLLPTQRFFRLLLAVLGLLSFSPLCAQNYNAGYNSGTGGINNTIVGSYAGRYTTTGSNNIFVGYSTGSQNTTGSYNSFLGYAAGRNNKEGYNNTFLGNQAGYDNFMGINNTFVGYDTGGGNTKGSDNVFMGSYTGSANIDGNYNTFLGYSAGLSNTEGSHNVLLGYKANTNNAALTNAGAIGSRAYVTAPNSLVLGAINGINGAPNSTNVGIGTTAPAYLLHVNGTAAKPGSSTWTVASDESLKKNVSAFTDGLDVLTQVRPVWFEYNGQAGLPTNRKHVGIIAQQMQRIAPYMVGRFTYQDTTGRQSNYLDYDANALTYILVNSVQQLNTRLQEKDTLIEALRQENETLEVRLTRLEQLLNQPSGAASTKTAAASGTRAQLWQNVPNPTDGTTRIRYSIPEQARQAQISLYSLKGELVKSFSIAQRGEGELSVDTKSLSEGVYTYRLLVDGQQVDAKKLLRQR